MISIIGSKEAFLFAPHSDESRKLVSLFIFNNFRKYQPVKIFELSLNLSFYTTNQYIFVKILLLTALSVKYDHWFTAILAFSKLRFLVFKSFLPDVDLFWKLISRQGIIFAIHLINYESAANYFATAHTILDKAPLNKASTIKW